MLATDENNLNIDPLGRAEIAPRPRHRPSRRDAVLAAGVRVFARRGYPAATISEVAAEAGVTPKALYYHFKGKEDLLAEAVRPVAAAVLSIVERAVERFDPESDHWGDTVVVVLTEAFEWCDAHGDEAKLYYVWARLGLPAASKIRGEVRAQNIDWAARVQPPPAPRSTAGLLAEELARLVAVDTAEEVMVAVFTGDLFAVTSTRHEIGTSLALNNEAILSTRRAAEARSLVRRNRAADRQGPRHDPAGTSPMSRAAHRPSRREELLEAAAAEFALAGVSDATIEGITRRAGMATRAAYYHFSSKNELFLAVVRRVCQEVADLILQTPSMEGLVVQLRDAWDRFALWIDRAAFDASIYLVASAGVSLDVEAVRRAAHLSLVAGIKEWLQKAHPDVGETDAQVGAISAAVLLNSAAVRRLTAISDQDRATLDAAFVDIALRIQTAATTSRAPSP